MAQPSTLLWSRPARSLTGRPKWGEKALLQGFLFRQALLLGRYGRRAGRAGRVESRVPAATGAGPVNPMMRWRLAALQHQRDGPRLTLDPRHTAVRAWCPYRNPARNHRRRLQSSLPDEGAQRQPGSRRRTGNLRALSVGKPDRNYSARITRFAPNRPTPRFSFA